MVEKLDRILRKSVEKILKGVKRPFGIFLSGGVDSSLLAYYAKPDVAITCRFPYGARYDEFSYARKTAKHLGLKQVVITPTKKDFFEYLPYAVKMFHPTTHFSLVPLYLLFKKADELGLKTIISAEGPDEYLGGYASYSLITNEQNMYMQEELKNYAPLLDKYLDDPMDRFARILGKEPKQLKPYWGKYKNLLSKIGYCDLKLRGIEEMELALAKGWDIKLLYPFMTKEVEKFCFEEVPDDWKIKGFTTKYIEKRVAENYLPAEVVWRKNKMGGPVFPVGKILGEKDEFSKDKYLKLQNKLWKQYL